MFPTDPWFQDLIAQINGSADYREAAATWEGDIAFQVEAEPDKGVSNDVHGLLDLWHGACRGGGVVDEARGTAAAYVISAPYSRWKEVVRGDLDPVRAMMQGKLRVHGDLPTIVRYVRAANELVHLCGEVDTTFPDEA
ncbi:MAG: SCP2 sterol-binding domain-containing protein [Actinomycetota bacterium]